MKIQIITSCTGKKLFAPANKLKKEDFRNIHNSELFNKIEKRVESFRTSAEKMYTGDQHIRLMEGVNYFRKHQPDSNLNLWILSAGYGLIRSHKTIVPYECTFRGMKREELHKWADHLQIPTKIQKIFNSSTDLRLVLLGGSYLQALSLSNSCNYSSQTLFLISKSTNKYVKGNGNLRKIILKKDDLHRFHQPWIGLKGEISKRILFKLANEGSSFIHELESPDFNLLDSLL